MRRLVLAVGLLVCWHTAAVEAKQSRDGYVLHLGGRTQISSLDVETLVAVDASLSGRVLWVQRDGRRYLIRDPSILDRIAEALRPVTEVSDEYEAFERRSRPVYDEEEELDRKIDAIEEDEDGDEASLDDLREQRRALAEKLRAVEAEDRRLDARQERAEAVFERFLYGVVDEAIRDGLAKRAD